MTRDNQRAVFTAQMEVNDSERWEVKHHIENKEHETQSVGFNIFDHRPTDDEIHELRRELLAANVWAAHVRIEIREA